MSAKLLINARVYSLNCAIDTLKIRERNESKFSPSQEKILDNYLSNKCYVFTTRHAIIGYFKVTLVTSVLSLASSETQGQLLTRTGFSWAKVTTRNGEPDDNFPFVNGHCHF